MNGANQEKLITNNMRVLVLNRPQNLGKTLLFYDYFSGFPAVKARKILILSLKMK
jgi:hypothetical protein